MALIPPHYLDCVVAIGLVPSVDEAQFTATGFLYGRCVAKHEAPQPSDYRVYLITNKHVLSGATSIWLRFNPTGSASARVYPFDLLEASGSSVCTEHPDPEIDVVAMRINAHLLREHGIQFSWFADDRDVLLCSEAAETGLSEGHGVFVLGFPLGDVGGARNFVIVRQGVLARIRDALSGVAKSFLVDATIFPGNSGGPVVCRPEFTNIVGTTGPSAAALIGVVASYVAYRDVAVSQQSGLPRVIFEENTGLAKVYTVDAIAQAVNCSELELFARHPEARPTLGPASGTASREA